MLFKPELAYKVLRGQKTETRRIVKLPASGRGEVGEQMIAYPMGIKAVQEVARNGNWRIVWQVGRDYPVQPGRGKKTLRFKYHELAEAGVYFWDRPEDPPLDEYWHKGYLTVDDLWREDVRNISEASVKAEGFDKKYEFLLIWMSMHDKAGFKDYTDWARWQALARWTVDDATKIAMEPEVAERVERIARAGDSALYDAWVIKFHRKEPA